MDVEKSFDAALEHHQAGNLDEAGALYKAVLQLDPQHSNSLHLLGVLAFQVGRLDVAITLIERAIAIKPAAGYFGNLGMVLAAHGKLEDALAAYNRAVKLKADFPEAHNNLAGVLRQLGRLDEAAAGYRQAISLRPQFAEAHNNLALVLADLGRVDEAITGFHQAIKLFPNYAEARNNLGNVLLRKGEVEKAVNCWREALALRPNLAEAHNNLGNALKQLGQLDDAVTSLRQALAYQPQLPEAHNNLGVIQFGRGQVTEAIGSYRQAITLRAGFAEAEYNLAVALHAAGETADAVAACRRALAIRPGWPQACNNLGIWLGEIGQPSDALAAFEQAIAARPDYPEALSNRGNILRQSGRLSDATASYRHAVALRPDSAEAHNNLGDVLRHMGRMEEATEAFRRTLTLQPNLAEAHNNLGNVLKDQGELDEAIACYERAVALGPEDAAADSNRVYTLHFHPRYDAQSILKEHVKWNERHARALSQNIKPHRNRPFPRRRLRIGYVSPDFRDHCQAMFTVPLFSHHDHDRFEIFCYSDVKSPDAVTDRLRGYADTWRNIAGSGDEAAAELIRQDRIDILVDLAVHMAHNRLLLFARKPAPVQVTWLGYPGTTGLETIDYRLSDPYLDPPSHDALYSERTVRLPDSFWCYDPLSQEPAVNELPARRNGHITFGCLGNFCKINDETLALWARVLVSTPRSRMLLLAPEGAARQRTAEILKQHGIDPARIDFWARLPRRRYLELYHRIDLCLDTFPYNGHTTSLDALWMGVPTATQIGHTAVGRGGWSQLCNLGLSDLAADGEDDFVTRASSLAADIARLRMLRSTLRDRLTKSPLMDAARFAGNMEAAYRTMWQQYSSPSPATPTTTPDGRPKLTVHVAPGLRRKRPTRAKRGAIAFGSSLSPIRAPGTPGED